MGSASAAPDPPAVPAVVDASAATACAASKAQAGRERRRLPASSSVRSGREPRWEGTHSRAQQLKSRCLRGAGEDSEGGMVKQPSGGEDWTMAVVSWDAACLLQGGQG